MRKSIRFDTNELKVVIKEFIENNNLLDGDLSKANITLEYDTGKSNTLQYVHVHLEEPIRQ